MIQDILTIGVLIILEGVLSIDNALVLAVMARTVPAEQQKKVLTYGLIGAVFLRMGAIFAAKSLLQSSMLKIFGALYLLFLTVRHFVGGEDKGVSDKLKKAHSFWMTVALVEVMDLAFAVDSILAAVALTQKYWLIVTGGLIGTVMMRFAANAMIQLLNKYPKLEDTAFILVGIIGLKLALESAGLPGVDFHSKTSVWFWGQWISMLLAILYGFARKDGSEPPAQ